MASDAPRILPVAMALCGLVFTRSGAFVAMLEAKRRTRDRSCLAIPADKVHAAYLSLAEHGASR